MDGDHTNGYHSEIFNVPKSIHFLVFPHFASSISIWIGRVRTSGLFYSSKQNRTSPCTMAGTLPRDCTIFRYNCTLDRIGSIHKSYDCRSVTMGPLLFFHALKKKLIKVNNINKLLIRLFDLWSQKSPITLDNTKYLI